MEVTSSSSMDMELGSRGIEMEMELRWSSNEEEGHFVR